jgi:hypothetical protein
VSDEERIDFSIYYRTGTKPDWWTEAAWKIHMDGLTEEERKKLANFWLETMTPPLPTKDPEMPRRGTSTW